MPTALFVFLALISLQDADSLGLRPDQLILERVTGPPPIKSRFLTEDSGSQVRRARRHGPPGMNILFNFTAAAPNSTMMTVRVLERHDNSFKSELLQYKINLCKYLAMKGKDQISTFKDIMKFPCSCPLGPGVFKVENWQVSEVLPPLIPLTEGYKIRSLIEFTKTDFILNDVYFRVGRR